MATLESNMEQKKKLKSVEISEERKETLEDKIDHTAYLIRWLEKHKEYLKTYPPLDDRGFSFGIRNYPLIDCAKAEKEDLVSELRHGRVKEKPYQNPFTKKKEDL